MRLMICAIAAGSLFATQALAATTFTYDSLGRITTVTYDNGKTITYTYDAAGNRTEADTSTSP